RHTLDRYRPLQDQDVPDADVIIATWWETAEWIAPLSAAKGVKVYFVQHHEVFDYLPQERVEATYRLPFFHITIAQWLVDLLRDRYQSPAIALVPNGVDLDQFNCPVRNKASIPTIGFVYSATPWKGSDIALQAYESARQSIPNLRLITFGTEAPKATLALPPNAQHQVQPPQSDLKTLYSQCDAWLFSSRVEGFGLPILEAMACRTPVIATPVGAAPELLASGGGILLNAVDPREMAIAIQKLCQLGPHQWQDLSSQAYEIASKHTWSGATDLFEAALYQALDRTD
ncbi:MAG TPA: glycosyltransferase family 4 protein, partial [Stenomitos sp.]